MTSAESIKDGDYKIQQISRLLESGGTMLAQHCNVCGAPFFRYHGEILCPVCSTFGEQPRTEPAEESASVSQSQPEPAATSSPQAEATVVSPPQESEPETPEVSSGDYISTMLGKSCGVCGSPLFIYQDKVFCPMCDVERHISIDKTENKPGSEIVESSVLQEEVVVSAKPSESQDSVVISDQPAVSSTDFVATSGSESLEKLLLLNIEDLAAKMVAESDVHKVEEWLDLLERTVSLVERVKKL